MKYRKIAEGILVAVVLASVIVGLYFSRNAHTPFRQNYSAVYTLVADKVSASAPILVNLPKGADRDNAEPSVSFLPALKGQWVETALDNTLVFKPATPLKVGDHYSVIYKGENGEIKKDFMADDDPKVVDIFPRLDSEADESSAITISFNRPMVPLTSLNELSGADIPIDILPKTEGKFKWISTRSLQFIPATHLVRSTHYTVKVRPGLVSMDGLAVPAFDHTFITRPLRFEGATAGTIRYNQPVELRFNQPVNLQSTANHLTLTNLSTGKKITFNATYGKDTSIIRVYPETDRFGRKNMWDMTTNYSVSVSKAYSTAGDINYDIEINTQVQTTDILQGITVQSATTSLASVDLFDPQGSVTLSFYEDIDLGKSKIEAKGLKDIVYAQGCQKTDDNNPYTSSGTCKKIDDKKQLVLTFEAKDFSRGEAVPLTFVRIVNSAGQQLNPSTKDYVTLHVYPTLALIKVTPGNGDGNASVQDLIICSNSPLKPAGGDAFRQALKASDYLVLGRWDESYLQTKNNYDLNPPCATGNFVTRIHYGLHPATDYKLTVSPTDVFGQTATTQIAFRTEAAPKFYLRFNNLQKIYNVTTPDKTLFTYATENFDQVAVHICRTSGIDMLRYLSDQPSETTPGSSLSCFDSKTDIVDLPDTLWVNNYFQLDLKKYYPDPRGQYVISFSHPKYQNDIGQQKYDRTYVSVTNLAVGSKEVKWTKYDALPDITKRIVDTSGRGNLYWVSRIGTLAPVVGATVSLIHDSGIYGQGAQVAKIGMTNNLGVAEFPLVQDVVGAVITAGDDSAIVSDWADNINWSSQASTQNKVYLYTDRPIYRPGQEVDIKGLYRTNFDGQFAFNQNRNVELEVRDSSGKTVLNQNVALSPYGTFNTHLTLPASAPLGTYNISALDQYSFFEVQEYVGAAFETTAESNQEEYIAGETADISIGAKYYFGVPLDGGTLEYTLTAQNYYFDRYSDEYFNFGGDWYSCYDCGYGDSYIKRGQAVLDAEGRVTLSEKLEFDSLFKEGDRDQSKIIVLHGTVKDKQGKSVSFQRSFIVHRGDFYVGIKTDPSFIGLNQPFNVKVKTVDTQGRPSGHSGLTVDVQKIEWKSFRRQEVDGGFYNRYERVKTSVSSKKLGTNSNGDATLSLTLESAGEYEITVSGKDSNGNMVSAVTSQYVYGSGTVDVRQTNNATLDITAQNKNLKTGETGSLIIQSPFKQAKALIAIERGRILDYKIVDINQSIYNYTFSVIDDYIPNVYVSALLLSGDPQVKFGQVQFTVNRKDKALTIDVKSAKNSYLPGEQVALDITTTDANGQRVPAEVSVSVADLSVLALAGNQKKDPLVFFYNGFPLTVMTATNVKNILSEVPIPTGTKGGDGGDPGDLATRKRGEFKDTAFWQAQVVTNAQGQARVSFTLPDNLTRWQVETIGITSDTKLGVNYSEITAQKDIMVVPIKPRFAVAGDEFSIGAKIFNQTKENQTLSVSFSSDTLAFDKKQGTRTETIKAGEASTIYFTVTAPLEMTSGRHVFTISAKNKSYNDTVENVIPLKENTTFESVATANSTSADGSKEYVYIPDGVVPNQGGLTVKTSATLAVYLSDALKSLIEFPDGCGCSLASELSSLAIVKRGLAVKNVGDKFNLPPIVFDNKTYTLDEAVKVGLDKLYNLQSVNGGFSYYEGLEPSLTLSIQVLNTLVDLRGAGVTVSDSVITNVSNFIVALITKAELSSRPINDTDTLIIADYALGRAGTVGTTRIEQLLSLRLNTAYLNEKISSNSLAYLALISLRGNSLSPLKKSIMSALENRIEIDSRGAYLKSKSDNLSWQYFETPVKTTALFLKVLTADRKEFSQTANMMRWLLASRRADGAWGGSDSTLAVVDAFTDYLNWKTETESDFSLGLSLDGTKVETFDFNRTTVLSVFEKFLPLSVFSSNKIQVLSFDRVNRNNQKNNFYYDIGLKYYLPAQEIPPRDEGIAIERHFYSLLDSTESEPRSSAKVGEVIKGQLTIISPKARNLFTIEDVIPAGFELVNFNLATEDEANLMTPVDGTDELIADDSESISAAPIKKLGFWAQLRAAFGPRSTYDTDAETLKKHANLLPVDFSETHDDSLHLFVENLPAGEYTYEYYLRATVPGTFRHLPAEAFELNYPENFGRTSGSLFEVRP